MAYDLPIRGELDWDVKLYASIEAVKVLAETAQTATQTPVTPVGSIAATTVQAALAELDAEKAPSSHTHPATDVSFAPAGTVAAATVQAAIVELDSEKATPAQVDASIATHASATDPHGDRAYADGLAAYKGVRVGLSVAQSIPTGTTTVALFDTEVWDDGGWHSNTLNPGRLTVPAGVTGKFLIVGAAGMYGTTGTYREVQLRKNGATANIINFAPAAWARYLMVSVVDAAPGDFFELAVQHDAGAALNLEATPNTFLTVSFLGA